MTVASKLRLDAQDQALGRLNLVQLKFARQQDSEGRLNTKLYASSFLMISAKSVLVLTKFQPSPLMLTFLCHLLQRCLGSDIAA